MRRAWYLAGALLAAVGTAPLAAQGTGGTIRGRVTDAATQAPLQGVAVSVAGRSALTQADGHYTLIGLPAGNDTLRARMIGYSSTSRAVTIAAGQPLDVDLALAAQAVNLAEIVVTGYGEQRAGNITGAVTQVSAADFNTGRVVSAEELIRSKVPGVQVSDNNEPGGGVTIRVRGPTSINASSDPLFVVDGVPVGTGSGGGLSAGRNPLNFLNPNDIESITVLRDASAAAIYGANAANGVILIQTKRGKRGAPQFEYTGSMSSSSVTRLPSMLNAEQFRAAVTQYAPQNVPQLQSSNTDWFSIIDRTAFGQEHNLAVSGADENTNWRLSGGYLNQDGIIRGTNTQRVSLGVNMDQRLFSDRLDVHTFLKGSRAKDQFTPGGVLSNAAQFGPTQPVYDATRPTGYYDWPGPGNDYKSLQSADNPLALLNLATDNGNTYRSIGNVDAKLRLPYVEGLAANANLGYDITRTDRQWFYPSTLHGQIKSGNGGNDHRQNQSQSNTGAEAYLSYNAPFRVVPGTIDLTGGYSYSWSHAEYPYYDANGLSTDLLGGNGVTTARSVVNFQDIEESKLISFFGRANYNLNDRYLLGASVRRDGSSRFGPDNQWGTFPSVSAGWRISQEPFFRGIKALSDLKIRGSWAKTGNQAFANYQQYAAYLLGNTQAEAQFGDIFVPTIRPNAVDPGIKWEETKSYDVGLDFGLFNSRVSGAIDWYTKNTSDLIFTVPVAAGTNLSNFLTTNIGTMRNKGLELTLSAQVLQGRQHGLTWSTDFTAAHNTNELLSINTTIADSLQPRQQILVGGIAGGVGSFIQVLKPGYPVNSFFVYQHKLENGKPIYKDVTGLDANGHFTGVPDGKIDDQDLYVDQNGDGKINQDDRRPFHDPAPKWMLGHSSYLSYESLDLSFTLRAYLGNYVYNNVASDLGTYSEVTRGAPYNLQASVLQTGFQTQQLLSDYYVENAAFLRMDNITLGFTFKYRHQPVRVFGTVQNAFTITGYSGVDPTAGLIGIDNNIYPRSRTFTTGITFRF